MASRSTNRDQSIQIMINGQAAGRNSGKDLPNADKSLPGRSDSPDDNSALEQIAELNRRLVGQIETLRYKIELDAKHQAESKKSMMGKGTEAVKSKEAHIETLQNDLHQKDQIVKVLKEENQKKAEEINQLEANITDLREDVRISKEYAKEIQGQLEMLQSVTVSLEKGSAYQEKDKEIEKLRAELHHLKSNLSTLEKELAKTKETIAHQGSRLRLADNDRLNLQAKFKEDLAKVTRTMRSEIERTRDQMHIQCSEMRQLREQNEDMRTDLREIRELLTNEHAAKNQTRLHQAQTSYSVETRSPALPDLTREYTKRNLGAARKKN